MSNILMVRKHISMSLDLVLMVQHILVMLMGRYICNLPRLQLMVKYIRVSMLYCIRM